jgi:hypothetical protein
MVVIDAFDLVVPPIVTDCRRIGYPSDRSRSEKESVELDHAQVIAVP